MKKPLHRVLCGLLLGVFLVPWSSVSWAQRVEPPTPALRHRDRLDRATLAARDGRLLDAESIITENLPAPVETPEGAGAYASRMAALACRLGNENRHDEAKWIGGLAVEACSIYLQTKPQDRDAGQAARYLALTGFLLERIVGEPDQARETYLLAYQLDPNNQTEALYRYEALAERERVIAERVEHADREKGGLP